MAYFECIIGGAGTTLTVTCESVFAGKTITCTNGTTTLTAVCPSTSPYVVKFEIEDNGTWTISGTYNGATYTESVLIPLNVSLETTKNILVTVYSAANDAISYTGLDGNTHMIATDSTGVGTATIRVNGSGSTNLTFKSSVAKSTSNLSNPYSKTITLTPSTTSLSVMPNGALYWYGNKCEHLSHGGVGKAASLGYTTNIENYTITDSQVEFYTNYFRAWIHDVITTHSVATRNTFNVTSYSYLKMYGYAESGGDGKFNSLGMADVKVISRGAYKPSTTNQIHTFNISSVTGNKYIYAEANWEGGIVCNALWLE